MQCVRSTRRLSCHLKSVRDLCVGAEYFCVKNPDPGAFADLLRNCKSLEQGKQVHAHIVRAGFREDHFLGNLTIRMYGRLGDLESAKEAFDAIRHKNSFSWTTLITANAHNGLYNEAFAVLWSMELEGFRVTGSIFITLLAACCSDGRISEGRAIHRRAIASGLEENRALQNTLVNLYGKFGSLEEARRVFDGILEKDIISWNSLICAYALRGCCREALELFREIKLEPTHVTFLSVLRACSVLRDLNEGKRIHARVSDAGFNSNLVVCNSLINMYGKCGSLEDARSVYNRVKVHRNIITWNSMICACLEQGEASLALELFFEELVLEPNQVTFVSILSACSVPHFLDQGKRIHELVLRSKCEFNDALCSSLITMYGKCGSVDDAFKVFNGLETKGLISWTAMVAAYGQNEHENQAISLFQEMEHEGLKVNKASFIAALSACSSLRAGEAIHRRLRETGFESDVLVGTALLSMYGRHGKLEAARQTFDRITERDVFAWTTMMEVYTEQGFEREATLMFHQLELEGLKPTEVTFIGILDSCSELSTVKSIHSQIAETQLEKRLIVSTSLVYAYSKCGSLEDARLIFERLIERDIVSWNSIIGGYSRRKDGHESLHLFRRMDLEGVAPNDVTFLAVLDACTCLNEVVLVRIVHECIILRGFQFTVTVANALINVYSKCGKFQSGRRVFDEMSIRDMVSWSSIIAAYAQHGEFNEAFKLFEEMQLDGTEPGETIFLLILFSASHTGLVEKALHYFWLMVGDWESGVRVDHYACIVDALARSGWLGEAEELVNSMPNGASAVQWMTLLGWCKVHSEPEMAARAAQHVFHMEPDNCSPYALLSSTFAASE